MSSPSSSHEELSLKLSEVLSDIGVNHGMIMKRRKSALFRECVMNIHEQVDNVHFYLFGSLSEGSTTEGLRSDVDVLGCPKSVHVIHDLKEWLPGRKTFLMIQDETTSPGYCLLQHIKDGVSLASNIAPSNIFLDVKGRALLKNEVTRFVCEQLGLFQHGPAVMPPVEESLRERDYVIAYNCPSWSADVRRWVYRHSKSGWPTAECKSQFEKVGCFIVPVASKTDNGLDELEWRISTSLHERHLMFSLNTTQLSCYVIMKMFLKTHSAFEDVISSYMCKTTLFHCIENTNSDFYQEHNLILCLRQVLWVLFIFIYCGNCPHFIIPGNNLMAGRISREQKYKLLKVIQYIFSNTEEALFEIQILVDVVGERLKMKMNIIHEYSHHVFSPVELQRFISGALCFNAAGSILESHYLVLNRSAQYTNNVHDTLVIALPYMYYYIRLYLKYPSASDLEQKAYSYMLPLFCSTIGSLLASYYIALNRPMLNIAWEFLKLGYYSDVSSGLLKLATVCYSIGDYHVTESILYHLEQQYDRRTVLPVCGCYYNVLANSFVELFVKADPTEINDFRHIVSYCVHFLPFEVHAVPQELRQEYSRSTPADCQTQGKKDKWMNCAVVDSLPYLYFLKYKTYGRLRDVAGQQRALNALVVVTRVEPTLNHRETALNLLGQCMEQENRPTEAVQCYERSLQVRARNNAANIHMSRLCDISQIPSFSRKRKFDDI